MSKHEIDCECGERTCYASRRAEIDRKALAIAERELKYCDGMDFDVQAHAWNMAAHYRDHAVNELAWEFVGYGN